MANKPTFTQDWFSQNIPHWSQLLTKYKNHPYEFLEIGCFEGRATLWLLENILLHKDSKITVIDTFKGSMEHGEDMVKNLQERFLANIEPHKEKVEVIPSSSAETLPILRGMNKKYDLIYIDGSHVAKDVMEDAINSWHLLKPGGTLIFDDYGWRAPYPEHHKPKMAIDMFLTLVTGEYRILAEGYQIVVRKNDAQ